MTDHREYIDATRVRRRLVDLIRIPSVTGQEDAVIGRLSEWLWELGVEVDYWNEGIADVLNDPNYPGHEVERAWLPVVIGVVRGRKPGPTVVLTGHLDVVPPGDINQWTLDPYSGYMDGDTVYGRGASDMKSGVVSALEAFEAFAKGPRTFAGRVVFVGVPAEEDSGLGTLAAIRRGWYPDAVVVPEPTLDDEGSPKLVVAHAGAMSFFLEVTGLAAHASRRHLGESALDHYLAIHRALREDEKRINDGENHPLMRALHLPYATNVGLINGGNWSSSVMDRLTAEIRVGVPLNETVEQARARIQRVITEACAGDTWLEQNPPQARLVASGFGSAQTPMEHPLVTTMADAAASVFGRPARIAGAPYGCDMSAWVRLTGAATVVYGPGDIDWAHSADERVSLDATERVAHVLVQATEKLLTFRPGELRLQQQGETHAEPD
ncbi:acetylornithine deacetylase [Halospina denitrificans]|uniref:Acetylornithine deacetylase n=1 Tax=Halospina denitrificans TaxID=332522 RepID=A0A4R7JVM7_9GAMM|nr:ArgE/DapE family deacylase [Halospina denitrificans]TDT41483.1 acetylornithine deacetylase [Halospina denitrificans]